jgi:hypothetical protein
MVTLLLLSYCLLEATARATAVAYYVDACNGDDRNAGLSSAHAWRSLERVNAAKLAPGDHVLFQRGDIWRGQLLPQSGAEGLPITYAAYGRGPKPRLLGSVARDRVAEWKPVGDSLWSAGDCAFNTELVLTNFAQSRWHVHCEAGARAPAHFNRREAPSVDHATVQITCRSPGTAAHHIQLSTGGIAIQQGAYYVFEFRARASQRAAISRVGLIEPAAPYHDYSSLACPRLVLQPEWKQFAVRFRAVTNTPNALIVLYLGGGLPVGTTSEFTPLAFNRATFHASEALLLDVGNVIFDHGTKIGVKKWTPADLRVPGDFWYDPETWRLLLRADRNPATLFSSVELALRQHVVSQGGRSWVTYENLAIMYGAAHGIGGGSTHHIQVRDCDFCYLGGGHQFDLPDGRPVRFGNASSSGPTRTITWSKAAACGKSTTRP